MPRRSPRWPPGTLASGGGEVVAGVEHESRSCRARSCRALGVRSWVARRISSVAATLPSSNAPMPTNRRAESPVQDRAELDADRLPRLLGRRAGCADRVDDRDRGEQAGDDADEHRGADADERDERDREQRAADRAEVVHRPLEPVRAPVDVRRARRRRAARCGPARAGRAPTRRRRAGRRPARRRSSRRSATRRPRWPCSRRRALRRRRSGSSASAPPANRATPAQPSAIPSISPSAAADAPSVVVRKLGSSAVGTSCPTSARRLAPPIPATPRVSHGRWGVGAHGAWPPPRRALVTSHPGAMRRARAPRRSHRRPARAGRPGV